MGLFDKFYCKNRFYFLFFLLFLFLFTLLLFIFYFEGERVMFIIYYGVYIGI